MMAQRRELKRRELAAIVMTGSRRITPNLDMASKGRVHRAAEHRTVYSMRKKHEQSIGSLLNCLVVLQWVCFHQMAHEF